MIRQFFFIAIVLLGYVGAWAQSSLDAEFLASVKSVNEFMARFNGDERKPSVVNEGDSRRNNILALFDFKIDFAGTSEDEYMAMVEDFIHQVDNWHGRLRLVDADAWAELPCQFAFNKKNLTLTLVMHMESMSEEEKRWTIAGVRGLREAGLYGEGHSVISPVEHETHFMGLNDLFNLNKSLLPSLRPQSREIDELSMFLGLAMCGALQFRSTGELKVHFIDVPGYIFTIEEIGRQGNNSGWLITHLAKADVEQKEQFTLHLFGFNHAEE